MLVAPNFMPSNMAVSACKTAPFLESALSPWEADEQWILLIECICLQLLMVVSQCPCTRPFLQSTQQKWKAGWGGGQTVFKICLAPLTYHLVPPDSVAVVMLCVLLAK